MIKLSKERLRAALPRLTPAEQDELLTILEQERVEVETTEARWTEIEATRPPLESFIPSLTEIARAHYERREMHLKKLLRDSQPPADNIDEALEYWFSLDTKAGELAEADGFPAKPSAPEPKATIADTPDVPTRVPPGRRGKLLDDVLARTTEEQRRSTPPADDDRLALYRRGPVDLDGGGYSDE